MADLDPAAVLQLGSNPVRSVGPAGGLVHVSDLAGQPDPPQRPGRVGPVLPGVLARLRDAARPAGMANVEPLPGQRVDHREEPFGLMPSRPNTSLTFRATASSLSSCLIRRRAAASSSC